MNRPPIHEFFGREFSRTQLRERSVELERRDGRVRMANEEARVDRATASKDQSRRHAFGVFGVRRGVPALGCVPDVDVTHAPNYCANSLQLEQA